MVCQHATEKGHDGVASKAHWVPPNFKKTVLPTLLIAFVKPTSGTSLSTTVFRDVHVTPDVVWGGGEALCATPWSMVAPAAEFGFSRSAGLFSMPCTEGTWLALDELNEPGERNKLRRAR